MEDVLPSDVFLRCLMGAGVWRIGGDISNQSRDLNAQEAATGRKICPSCNGSGFELGSGHTFGPWSVSRSWRDAFRASPDPEDLLVQAMISVHGASKTLDRVMNGGEPNDVFDHTKMAEKAFVAAFPSGIQVRNTLHPVRYIMLQFP